MTLTKKRQGQLTPKEKARADTYALARIGYHLGQYLQSFSDAGELAATREVCALLIEAAAAREARRLDALAGQDAGAEVEAL